MCETDLNKNDNQVMPYTPSIQKYYDKWIEKINCVTQFLKQFKFKFVNGKWEKNFFNIVSYNYL